MQFIKRHFFLVAAIGLVLLMALAVLLRTVASGSEEGGGGPGGPGGRAQAVQVVAVGERDFITSSPGRGNSR